MVPGVRLPPSPPHAGNALSGLEPYFALVVALATSALGYLAGRKLLALSGRGLGMAVGKAFECVGLTAGFYAANLILGMSLVGVLRALSGSFVSLYLSADYSLMMVSLFQALVFQWWREGATPRRD